MRFLFTLRHFTNEGPAIFLSDTVKAPTLSYFEKRYFAVRFGLPFVHLKLHAGISYRFSVDSQKQFF